MCQPVTRSLEIVFMRPRPGGECKDIVERRWRDVVEFLRGASDELYIEVDILKVIDDRVDQVVYEAVG